MAIQSLSRARGSARPSNLYTVCTWGRAVYLDLQEGKVHCMYLGEGITCHNLDQKSSRVSSVPYLVDGEGELCEGSVTEVQAAGRGVQGAVQQLAHQVQVQVQVRADAGNLDIKFVYYFIL